MRYSGKHTRYIYRDGVIWDLGEIAEAAPVQISLIDARWRAARYRHQGVEAVSPEGAEYCRARFTELQDALGAWLNVERRAA